MMAAGYDDNFVSASGPGIYEIRRDVFLFIVFGVVVKTTDLIHVAGDGMQLLKKTSRLGKLHGKENHNEQNRPEHLKSAQITPPSETMLIKLHNYKPEATYRLSGNS